VAATLSMEIFLCLDEATLHCIEVGLPSYQKMAVSVDFSLFNIEITVGALLVYLLQIEVLEPTEIKTAMQDWNQELESMCISSPINYKQVLKRD
jgi:hypothetical protein